MKPIIKTLILAAFVFAASVSAQAQILKTHVETGDVQGVADEGLAVYKAIPYAAPTAGHKSGRAVRSCRNVLQATPSSVPDEP